MTVFGTLGLGVITGASDDDPSAIGTYAAAGAKFGPAFLWAAPVMLPFMITVVYLSSKLGQVAGEGLFAVLRRHYSPWIYYPTLTGVLIGNTIEAGADMGGMAEALQLLVPLPIPLLLIGIVAITLSLQFWASYAFIRSVFRWLALILLAYIAAAFLARPNWGDTLRATLLPQIHFTREYLSLLVAMIGSSMSAYLYTWQSNQEVEEEIEQGRTTVRERRGTTRQELRATRWDVISGMFFSNLVMYFILLATSSALYKNGAAELTSAAQAAQALQPVAGRAAGALFALGVVGVGFLAVPVMTVGAAYDVAQARGWKHGLNTKPRQAPKFYATIAVFTLLGLAMNFVGVNRMQALVWAGIIQGISTPPLLFLILRMTGSRRIMGEWTNTRPLKTLGAITTATLTLTTFALFATWIF